MSIIKVNYKVASTSYAINKILKKLNAISLISFDTETQSLYSQQEIKQAKQVINKGIIEYDRTEQKLIKQIARASGLSNPDIVKVTHFIFGISEDFSYILIANSYYEELRIWKWLATYKGKVVIHNSLFDLKIMYNRIGKLPSDYEDTQLMLKTLINDADDFKARIGLKHVMGSYYDPGWAVLDDEGYNSTDYKKASFLNYCAIDGASTYKLYQLILDQTKEQS